MMEKLKELAMNPAHEILFREKTAKTTGKYFWAANINRYTYSTIFIYSFLYRFPAESQASRVYMVLYGAMLLICILTAVCGWNPDSRQKRKKRKASSSLHSIWLPGC